MVKEKTIGTLIGYTLAVVIIALCAFVSFYSFEHSIISYLIVSYAIWLIILLVSYFFKPSKMLPFCQLLSAPEVKAYQTYYLYLSRPAASGLLSSMVTALQAAALVWGALAIWLELYWQGGLCMIYFFLTANLIKKLNPWMKMGAKAEKGNKVARKQLYLVDLVQIKLIKYNEDRLD